MKRFEGKVVVITGVTRPGIGEATAARLDMPGLIELDLVAVKGKTQAVRIYTLPPEPVEAGQYLARHSALLAAYRQCDWAAARRLLEDEVLAAVRDIRPQVRLESPEEVGAFEHDLLAEFVLARASAGITEATISDVSPGTGKPTPSRPMVPATTSRP